MLMKSNLLTNFLIIFLAAMTPTLGLCQGKIFNIKQGQKAPFSGTLFDIEASADLTIRLENHAAQCKLRLTKVEEVCQAESKFKLDLKIAELDAISLRHSEILKIKNDQIKFLQKQASGVQPWYESNALWVSVGIVLGLSIAYGSASAWGQVAK